MESIFGFLLLVLGCVALEYGIARIRGHACFNFADSVTNLCSGILERLVQLLYFGGVYLAYEHIYSFYAVGTFPVNAWVWLGLFVLTDFLWYWFHRAGHEIRFFWAAHSTHHQSELFNLTVATRLSVFQPMIRFTLWAVLPWVGFHPAIVISTYAIQGAYQFFLHTQLIDKLGLLEHVLVTPSSHRVHHGRNEAYVNKNYGGFLIIWDKLFGTYTSEQEEVVYGLQQPYRRVDLFHAIVDEWKKLWKLSIPLTGLAASVRYWFQPAPFGKGDLKPVPPSSPPAPSPPLLKKYIFFQMILLVAGFSWGLMEGGTWTIWVKIGIIGFLIMTAMIAVSMLDPRGRGRIWEYVRLGIGIAGVTLLGVWHELLPVFVLVGLYIHLGVSLVGLRYVWRIKA